MNTVPVYIAVRDRFREQGKQFSYLMTRPRRHNLQYCALLRDDFLSTYSVYSKIYFHVLRGLSFYIHVAIELFIKNENQEKENCSFSKI